MVSWRRLSGSLFFVTMLAIPQASIAQQQAWTAAGSRYAGRLEGDSAENLRFVRADGGRDVSPRNIRRIDVEPSSFVLPNSEPPRLFVFRDGECLFGELRDWDDRSAAALLGDLGDCTFPAAALSQIGNITREADIAYEPHERPPTLWMCDSPPSLEGGHHRSGQSAMVLDGSTGDLRYTLDDPLAAGRLSIWYLDPGGAAADGGRWSLRLDLQSPRGPQYVQCLLVPAEDLRRIESSSGIKLGEQLVPRRAGWHKLTILLQSPGLRIYIDGAAVASAARFDGALVEVQLTRKSPGSGTAVVQSAPGEEAAVWVDDFAITRFTAKRGGSSIATPGQDVVVTHSGSELYGDIANIDSTAVELRGAFGSVEMSWADVERCAFQVRPTSSPWIAGLISRIELQTPVDVPHGPTQFLIAAIRSATSDHLEVEHPFLGSRLIPVARIARIEPLFAGSSLLLDPETVHVGDEIRAGFRVPEPAGSQIKRSFQLDQVPVGRVFFSAELAGLEPSGSATPPASPFLADLRDGFLKTTLWINQRRIADLNDSITTRRTSGDPELIRIPIPVGVLEEGENSYRLDQRSSRRDPHNFDDFEIGRVALEVEGDD